MHVGKQPGLRGREASHFLLQEQSKGDIHERRRQQPGWGEVAASATLQTESTLLTLYVNRICVALLSSQFPVFPCVLRWGPAVML